MKLKILVIFMGVSFMFLPLKTEANKDEVNEKDFYDSYITLLNPYVYKIISEKVGPDRSYDLFNVKILDIKRNIPGRTEKEKEINKGVFDFTVKVQYKTFYGPHNPPYGLETLTLRITPSGVKLINFKHQDI
ncbi:DUF3888 domain-containing protein [Bacillus chungangensis]|uniref:DUF3888 domain-containing protein n=1 Tax=Bacillus chungangensis TaxID=587633 RepID=A0ABT9WQ21_9BACI|nr:DUF3888 domain-containing protein [Bacillus chungangensis]MDQ0175388.1 hypothetical protein [Bacillus chungangensis]